MIQQVHAIIFINGFSQNGYVMIVVGMGIGTRQRTCTLSGGFRNGKDGEKKLQAGMGMTLLHHVYILSLDQFLSLLILPEEIV